MSIYQRIRKKIKRLKIKFNENNMKTINFDRFKDYLGSIAKHQYTTNDKFIRDSYYFPDDLSFHLTQNNMKVHNPNEYFTYAIKIRITDGEIDSKNGITWQWGSDSKEFSLNDFLEKLNEGSICRPIVTNFLIWELDKNLSKKEGLIESIKKI